MSVQTDINAFDATGHREPSVKRRPPPPDDSELEHYIAPNWMYDFEVESVANIRQLRGQIRDAEYATNRVEAWSHILSDHLSYGNMKLSSEVAIFNTGAASDCVNLGTKFCQVEAEECYAVRSENNYPQPRSYRRRQRIVWDHLDATTWSKAFRAVHDRKRNPVTVLRMSESGDFRTRHDILKTNEIARRLDDIVDTYTYSASSWLDWSEATEFVVNRSNDRHQFGDRRFEVVESVDDIPDGGIHCPHDLSAGEIQCGDCRLCIDTDAPDIYVKKF